jgi:putative SOS response-associated peptidase YedK
MCGRYSAGQPQAIPARFPKLLLRDDLAPRYNVAPSQAVSVALNDGSNMVTHARWGLVPAWANSVEGQKVQPINAKVETLAESRMFAPLVKRRRCILFADGFYEWRTERKQKTPVYFRLKSQEVFAFAGLWDVWHDQLVSCALLTGEPNILVAPVHNRMPVMLDPDDAMTWIQEGDASLADFLPMLRPYPADLMEAFPVSPKMNSPTFDLAEAIQPA